MVTVERRGRYPGAISLIATLSQSPVQDRKLTRTSSLEITEHMEPDEPEDVASGSTFPPWVSLEYAQMLLLVGPSSGSNVMFSSLSSRSVNALKSTLEKKSPSLTSGFRTETRSVMQIMEAEGVKLERVCLLDPKAELEISPGDAKDFDWFL